MHWRSRYSGDSGTYAGQAIVSTAHISIGNTDGKLTQAEWAEFFHQVDVLVNRCASAVYGIWHSLPVTPYVNACWAVEVWHEEELRQGLAALAREFRQDSIALLMGETEFIEAAK